MPQIQSCHVDPNTGKCVQEMGRRRSMFMPVVTMLVVTGLLVITQNVAAGQQQTEKRIDFTGPAAPWNLTLPANDFVVLQSRIKPDGRYGYFYLSDKTKYLNVSFFIEPAVKCTNSRSCRDMVLEIGNPMWENPKNIVKSEIGEISVFEFLVPSLRGQPIQQQNMYAQFVVDGFWVDLHMSKVLYKPEERKLFEGLVKAVKFAPKENKHRSQPSQ